MSTGQATTSPSTLQSIIDALVDYTKVTGIDLSDNPVGATIEQSNSPESILELLQERAKAFREYRDGNRRLINCLRPAVKVIHSFSGILGEAASLVSCACHSSYPFNVTCQVPFPPTKALFAGIDSLLAVRPLNPYFNWFSCDKWARQAASGVTSSYDALLELFECLGSFLKRLEIYTTIPPNTIMTEVIVKIMLELLSVLALASKQIKQGRFSECAIIFILSLT